MIKCPYCGSERIEFEIAWGKSAESGNVGLKYNNGTGLQVLFRYIPTVV